jgi:hypothetical protein
MAFVGRLEDQKGADVLLGALPHLLGPASSDVVDPRTKAPAQLHASRVWPPPRRTTSPLFAWLGQRLSDAARAALGRRAAPRVQVCVYGVHGWMNGWIDRWRHVCLRV